MLLQGVPPACYPSLRSQLQRAPREGPDNAETQLILSPSSISTPTPRNLLEAMDAEATPEGKPYKPPRRLRQKACPLQHAATVRDIEPSSPAAEPSKALEVEGNACQEVSKEVEAEKPAAHSKELEVDAGKHDMSDEAPPAVDVLAHEARCFKLSLRCAANKMFRRAL